LISTQTFFCVFPVFLNMHPQTLQRETPADFLLRIGYCLRLRQHLPFCVLIVLIHGMAATSEENECCVLATRGVPIATCFTLDVWARRESVEEYNKSAFSKKPWKTAAPTAGTVAAGWAS
jgi:hypothetical protein